MAGFTKKDETNKEFAQGGNGHMFGQQHVGEQKPGTTAHSVGGDDKFAKGGSGKMHGYSPSAPAKSGQTSP